MWKTALSHSALPQFNIRGYWRTVLGFEGATDIRKQSQLDLTHPTAEDKRRAAAIALDNALLKFMARNEMVAAQSLISVLQETFVEYSGFANHSNIVDQSRLCKSMQLQSVNTDACIKFLIACEYCALAGDPIRAKAVMSLAMTIFVEEFWDDVKEDYLEQRAVGIYA